MAPNADPYRTLGLVRGASLTEVKRAYRRLAKSHHPDAAGEGALPRFLAIQAAYDQIIHGQTGGSVAGGTPRRPWEADPVRADATRRAYGRRARPTGGSTRRRTAGSTNASDTSGPAGSGASRGGEASAGPGPGGASGRGARAPKATLGSTSYDGAEAEPFEPDWAGASWYGTTSGTYWTLNPKEYADPRKHGPEYQARARRAVEAERRAANGHVPASHIASDPGPAGQTVPDPDRDRPLAADPPPSHTTTSWWAATSASPADPGEPATTSASSGDPSSVPSSGPERAAHPATPPAEPVASGPVGSLRARVERILGGRRRPVS